MVVWGIPCESKALPITTFSGVVVQLVRIPACHAGGRGFESRPFRQFINTNRGVVQLVEHRSPKPGVGSSSLSAPAIIPYQIISNFCKNIVYFAIRFILIAL